MDDKKAVFCMKIRSSLSLAALAALCALSSMQSMAASRDEQTKACRGDAMRLCAADIPNEDKITACMKSKQDQLSPGCRAMFKSNAPSKSKPKHPAKPKAKPQAQKE